MNEELTRRVASLLRLSFPRDFRSATDLTGQPLGPWPIEAGWNHQAQAAIGMCIVTALAGVLAVFWFVFVPFFSVFPSPLPSLFVLFLPQSLTLKSLFLPFPSRYSWGALNDGEIEEEENRKQNQKAADLASGRKRGVRGLIATVTSSN